MDIIATMKAEADALDGDLVAYRETGEYLVNCRKLGGGGYEWRVIRDQSRGQAITERRAQELLRAVSSRR